MVSSWSAGGFAGVPGSRVRTGAAAAAAAAAAAVAASSGSVRVTSCGRWCVNTIVRTKYGV